MTVQELVKSKGLKWVFPRGNPKSLVWIVGEAPGLDEEQLGFSFVGASGKEQNRMLEEVGLDPNRLYFTNPYKIKPPHNKMELFETLGIPKRLFEEDFLTELRQYQPRIIVTVGETPSQYLCPDTIPRKKSSGYIHNWMGSLLRSPFLGWDHYVIPNLHPAYILRDWSERVVAKLVYAKALEEENYFLRHGNLQSLPRREIKFKLSGEELLNELSLIKTGSQVSFDIEMLKRRFPYTISFAVSPYRAVAFKLWNHGNHGPRLLREMHRILSGCRLIGQNCTVFDIPWLDSCGFQCNVQETQDVMIRHHVRWPELKHRLAFTTMQYTREPYYKDDGKSWSAKDSINQLLLYNGKDACVTFEIFLEQEEEWS